MTAATLSKTGAKRLVHLEEVIAQGMGTFVEVGNALVEIRDGKLYRENFDTFERYCQRRWKFNRHRASQLIQAAGLVTAVTNLGSPAPGNEWQARALSPVKDEPELAAAVMEAANAATDDQPTAPVIEMFAKNVASATKDTEPENKQQAAEAAITETRQALEEQNANKKTRTSKPDLGNGLSHPARYSDALLPVFVDLLAGCVTVLDPFAGTGRIHELVDHGFWTTGIELEPEWAGLHERTLEGNALSLPFADGEYDAICTSPTYGNRMADHHDPKDDSVRRSYKHDLGRDLHADNSGQMHWGDEYREFHERAWKEAVRVLRAGGTFVLNIKDHIRGGTWQDVTAWHVTALIEAGLDKPFAVRPVPTPSNRAGENAELRVGAEMVIGFRKP